MRWEAAEFETSAGVSSQLLLSDVPEVAFSGRSNVGKSSLINRLVGRKALARTSATPGKTATINFYRLPSMRLVDLPGYGYAKANVKVKEQWGKMIERYLHTSSQLRTVFLLLDIRHEPTGQDVMMYDWILQAGFTPVIIATKADKIKRSQIQKQIALLRRVLREESHVQGGVTGAQSLQIIPWSGQTKSGREEIYAVLDRFLADGADTEDTETDQAAAEGAEDSFIKE
jgi:GTP-binding protein